jgi:hypothetical protein
MFKHLLVAVAVSLSFAAPAAAQDDLARQAAVVAPFLDESTCFIARVDPGVDLGQAAALFGKPWLSAEHAAQIGQRYAALRQPFDAVGVREIYLISAPLDLWNKADPLTYVFAVVPVPQGSDPDTLKRLLHGVSNNVAEVRGDVVVAGGQAVIERLRKPQAAPRPELLAAWQATGGGQLQIAALPPAGFERIARETLSDPDAKLGFAPGPAVARGLKWAALGLNLPPKSFGGRFVIQSADEQAAEQIERLLARGIEEGEKSAGFALQFPSFLGRAKVALPKREGSQLVTRIDAGHVKPESFLELFQVPTVLAREKRFHAQSVNNLKQLALGMHVYHDVYKTLPPRASLSKDGKPLLSWRVALLPYFEQGELYKQFHLDEPWDSEHNKALIAKIPDVYKPATDQRIDVGKTCYLVPVGPGTIFEKAESAKFQDIKDGTSNTILIVESAPDRAVEWTRPDDWQFDPENPNQGLVGLRQGSFAAAFADGSVWGALGKGLSPADLRRLFQMADGEPIEKR